MARTFTEIITSRSVPQRLNTVLAVAPLALLMLLTLARVYAARTFVLCETGRCISIATNLNKVLITGQPNQGEPDEKQWAADAQKKEMVATAERTGQVFTGRMNWLFLSVAYLIVSLVGAVVAGAIIHRPVKRKHARWPLIAITFGAVIALVLFLLPELHMPLLLRLLPTTLEKDISNITSVIDGTNSFGFAAAFLLTLATAAVLWEVARPRNSLDDLARAMKQLRVVLYVGTVMLVIGMLFERCLFQWSLAFLSREEQPQKIAQSFFAGIVAVDGGFYTMLLAAVYLPAALIVRARTEQLAALPAEESDRAKTLKEHGLDFSFSEALPRLLAILAPLLAGPIGELFGRLAK